MYISFNLLNTPDTGRSSASMVLIYQTSGPKYFILLQSCSQKLYPRSQFWAGDIYGSHISVDKVGLSLNSPNTILPPPYLTSDRPFHPEE